MRTTFPTKTTHDPLQLEFASTRDPVRARETETHRYAACTNHASRGEIKRTEDAVERGVETAKPAVASAHPSASQQSMVSDSFSATAGARARRRNSRHTPLATSAAPASSGDATMDRLQYLKETSEALREADDRRREEKERRIDEAAVAPASAATRALERFVSTLRSEGLDYDGERWQCPSCRSQGRKPGFVLALSVSGARVEMACGRGCRANTIRALLGAPPYFPTLARARTIGKFPHG
jgi:hypothetical protein